jgi:hypothetical protein
MKQWRGLSAIVADSHSHQSKKDQDLHFKKSRIRKKGKKLEPDRIEVKSRIRISIKVMQILKTA